MTVGMDLGAPDTVTEDNDGHIPLATDYSYVIDLSHLLAEQLGRQMSMMATYRVKGIHLSLRNVDDTLDNNQALAIGGRIDWYSPTKHRIDALQAARKYLRSANWDSSEESSGHPFAPWADDKMYKGLRFNWTADGDSVESANDDHTAVLAGTEFSMHEILDHYNKAIGGFPSEEGYDASGNPGDAQWISRVGALQYDTIYWNAAYTNTMTDTAPTPDGEIFGPSFQEFNWQSDSNHLAVLGGLMNVVANHCNTDAPGTVEDEYYIQCTIMVEGWEGF